MYENLYEKMPDAESYLRRIGLGGTEIEPNLETLDKLVHAQLTHVPFDDMDVWSRAHCPSLGIGDIFEKIVHRRRGGYCFELNSIFCALLKALGFESYMVAAYVMAGREEMAPPSHCGIISIIGGKKYFCDVGYGGPVPDGGVGFDGESRFGFRLESCGDFWDLVNEKSAVPEVRFRDVAILPVDLIPMNYYVSQSSTSLFRNQLHFNLRLDGGSVSIVDNEFKLRRGEERVERYIEPEDVPALMEEYFGIPAGEAVLREFGPVEPKE